MEAQSNLKTSKEIITYLAEQFPNCFSLEGEAKPLKIGIFYDLVSRLAQTEAPISKVRLRSALRTYTLSWRYLQSVKEGVQRVDLDGNPCEALTAEHVAHAQQQLKEAKARVKAQRAEQQKTAPARPKAAKSATNKKASSTTKHPRPQAKAAPRQYQAVDLATIKAGDKVKVNLGRKPVNAILIAIEKENVRVKLDSGMELAVKAEHLVV